MEFDSSKEVTNKIPEASCLKKFYASHCFLLLHGTNGIARP
jgi:hypothetical protein